jgi:putative oxidoreductase
MNRVLGKYVDVLYSAMRTIAGLLFACHGAQKLFGVFGGQAQLASPRLLTAGVIELGGGLLIAIGLWAAYAAFIASGEMAVAYFTVHAPGGLLPIVNRGELAVLYCFVFLFIASRGSGAWSVDALAGKRGSGAAAGGTGSE